MPKIQISVRRYLDQAGPRLNLVLIDVTSIRTHSVLQSLESYAFFEGTILEVRRSYIRAVFSQAKSDRMEDRPSQYTWRFDRYSPDTTYKRQLQVTPFDIYKP